MSTRSIIIKTEKDGTLNGVHCEMDGYLDEVGRTLYNDYQSPAKINKLFGRGDIEQLSSSVSLHKTEVPYTSFIGGRAGSISKYLHWQNLNDLIASIKSNSDDRIDKIFDEYIYLRAHGRWYYFYHIDDGIFHRYTLARALREYDGAVMREENSIRLDKERLALYH